MMLYKGANKRIKGKENRRVTGVKKIHATQGD